MLWARGALGGWELEMVDVRIVLPRGGYKKLVTNCKSDTGLCGLQ